MNITRDILHKLSANLIPFSFIPLKMLARPPETDHVSFSALDRKKLSLPFEKTRSNRNKTGRRKNQLTWEGWQTEEYLYGHVFLALNGASKWINRQDKNISLDGRKGQVNAWAGKTTRKNVDVSNGLAGSDVSDSFPSKPGCFIDESPVPRENQLKTSSRKKFRWFLPRQSVRK